MDTNEDFVKKYRDCIGFLEFDGKKFLALFQEDSEDCCFFYSPEYGEISLNWEDAKQSFTGQFPTQGLYNINGVACFFSRYPERQWRRSVHRNNTTIFPILQKLPIKEPTPRAINSIQTYEKIYFPSYPASINSALEEMNCSIAINNKFAISETPLKGKEKILWFKQTPVAFLDFDLKEVICKFAPLYQEIIDHFRKKEPEWTVRRK